MRTKKITIPAFKPKHVQIDGSQPYGPQAKRLRVAMGYTLREAVELGAYPNLHNLAHWENSTGPYKEGNNSNDVLFQYLKALGVTSVEIKTFKML